MAEPIPNRMQAMDIRDGALLSAELPVPGFGPSEILIRVAYVGVNRADILQVEGKYPAPEGASPLPGLEVSGWVAAMGDSVTHVTIGQEVCALLSGGGYAQYVVAPAAQVLPLPGAMDLKTAASLPEACATSIMALLHAGNLHSGEHVLVHGGSSGVGLLMAQIARHLGAEAFASVGGEQKAAFVKRLGVTPIDHQAAPFAKTLLALTDGQGADIIIDTLGGPALPDHLNCLRRGGRLITLGLLAGSAIPAHTHMARMVTHNLSWCGVTLRSKSLSEKAAIMSQVYAKLWPGITSKAIQPVIDLSFALKDAKKAHQRMQERLHMGKILLEVPGSS